MIDLNLHKKVQQYLKINSYQKAKNTIAKSENELNKMLDVLQSYSGPPNMEEMFNWLRNQIMEQKNSSGELLKITTRIHFLRTVKGFFEWLSYEKGYRNKINPTMLSILKPKIAQSNELRTYISLKNTPPEPYEVQKMYDALKGDDFLNLKRKSLLSILCYCGLRNSTVTTLPLGSLCYYKNSLWYVNLDPSYTKIKNSKYLISGVFFPEQSYSDDLDKYIKALEGMGFKKSDPLFGKLIPKKGENGNFDKTKSMVSKEYATTSKFVNSMLKEICQKANLEKTYTAHACRHYFAKYIKNNIKNNKRYRVLSKEEWSNLEANMQSPLKEIVIFALNTGMRKQNILQCKWQQINFELGFIEVLKQNNKGKKEIKIPLTKTLADVLGTINRTSEYIFVNPKTNKPYTECRKSFNTALEKSNIEDFHFHDLRRTVGTWLLTNGVDLRTIQSILCHSDISITERYLSVVPEQNKKAIEILDTYMTK